MTEVHFQRRLRGPLRGQGSSGQSTRTATLTSTDGKTEGLDIVPKLGGRRRSYVFVAHDRLQVEDLVAGAENVPMSAIKTSRSAAVDRNFVPPKPIANEICVVPAGLGCVRRREFGRAEFFVCRFSGHFSGHAHVTLVCMRFCRPTPAKHVVPATVADAALRFHSASNVVVPSTMGEKVTSVYWHY